MMQALIVEDELALQILYERILANVDYEVVSAQDGNFAIQKLEQGFMPRLIILDIRMPNCNGIEVLEYLKTYPHIHNVHVVIATASRDFENYATMLPSCEFLLKPVLSPHLLEIVKRLQPVQDI